MSAVPGSAATPDPNAAADDARVLRLSDGDDVVIARRPIAAGETVTIGGAAVTLAERVPTGFKLASTDLPVGAVIHRAGVPIGRLTQPVRAGDVVHLHNLESLYLRTHARGES